MERASERDWRRRRKPARKSNWTNVKIIDARDERARGNGGKIGLVFCLQELLGACHTPSRFSKVRVLFSAFHTKLRTRSISENASVAGLPQWARSDPDENIPAPESLPPSIQHRYRSPVSLKEMFKVADGLLRKIV